MHVGRGDQVGLLVASNDGINDEGAVVAGAEGTVFFRFALLYDG